MPTFHDHVSAVQRPASDGLLDIGDDAGPGQPPDVFPLEFLPPVLQDVDDPYLATLPSCLLTVVELPDRVCENSRASRLGLLELVAIVWLLVEGVFSVVRVRKKTFS